MTNQELAYWAGILDVKCSWGMRRAKGRMPTPVLALATTHEVLARKFAEQFFLHAYKTGPVWYVQATGDKLQGILQDFIPRLQFRSEQARRWNLLMTNIQYNRGTRHKPLTDAQKTARHLLIAQAEEADPFKAG